MRSVHRSAEAGKFMILGLLPVLFVTTMACSERVQENDVVTSDINVLLISIDTLRRDHMSLYGYARDTTPSLIEFAKEAVVFDQAVNTGGATLPVHMSMMTSLHPLVHGVTPHSGTVLAEPRTTLAEVLSEAGYSTAAFTDGGWVRGKFGFHQGFDVYDDQGGHFEAILPKAYDWIESHAGEKFFLFLHTYDVHSGVETLPYDSPEERYNMLYADGKDVGFSGCIDDLCASRLLRTINERILNEDFDPSELIPDEVLRYMIDLYDGSINYVDDELAALFRYLRELGIYDDTLIIVTSDHGEEFLEHGFFLHRQGVYDEVARVPLLIRFPFAQMAGTRFQGLVSTVDLMPSVLDYLEMQGPIESGGQSVMPQLQGSDQRRDDAVIASALRNKKWKLVISSKELFDLESDTSEQVNVIDRYPEEARMLMESWRRQVAELKAKERELATQDDARASEKVQLTPDEEEALRALGYVQ